jgi:hypothetical protein
LYYKPVGKSAENVHLMRLLDTQYTTTPFYGSRRMTAGLLSQGYAVNRKRVTRLMQQMVLSWAFLTKSTQKEILMADKGRGARPLSKVR